MRYIIKLWRKMQLSLNFNNSLPHYFAICSLILPCKQMLEVWELE